MKTLIVFLFLTIGFTCNPSNNVENFSTSDCGVTIESPYLADDLIFGANEELTIALRFIQYKKTPYEKDLSGADLLAAVDSLNIMFAGAKLRFVTVDLVIDTNHYARDMSDYRNAILTYKRLNAKNLPAIDIFVYPVDFNYYPGLALAIKSDGIAIQKKFITTNTLAHEIGHCLGLHHTHQSRGNGYDAGDFICDTPSTGILNGKLIDANCNYDKKPNDLSDEDMRIIIDNYMSYVNRDCRKEFTKDQIDKMRYNLAKEPMLRNILIF
jgi:hypothetical protein